jgi:hypothetical protein
MKKVLLILAITASTALLANGDNVRHQTTIPTHNAISHSVQHSPKVVYVPVHVVKSHPKVVYVNKPHTYYGFNDRAHEYNHWNYDNKRDYRR